jgi:hypothetical protein
MYTKYFFSTKTNSVRTVTSIIRKVLKKQKTAMFPLLFALFLGLLFNLEETGSAFL